VIENQNFIFSTCTPLLTIVPHSDSQCKASCVIPLYHSISLFVVFANSFEHSKNNDSVTYVTLLLKYSSANKNMGILIFKDFE
jgi:hypothetical protein